jgi:hypothetical protein
MQPDFLAWQQHQPHASSTPNRATKSPRGARDDKQNTSSTFQYLVERRDGTMLEATLPLGGSVQDVLQNISESLQHIGAYSLPALSTLEDGQPQFGHESHQDADNRHGQRTAASTSSSSEGINHQYDVKSRQGRNLQDFLSNLSLQEIQERQLDRMDAQAAALEARRVFQFQSVDATSLGWSSASVAVLLKQLLALQEEFVDKLHVASFYPMQLLFTSDEFYDSLDVYGGVLRLNPASTKLQWLEKLQLVTDEALERIRFYRTEIVTLAKRAQGIYNVRFKKGHTCSSQEFYDFLCRICSEEENPAKDGTQVKASNSLVVTPVTATIESEYGCRRAVVTKEGEIRLGAGMDRNAVTAAINKLSSRARDQEKSYISERKQCNDVIHRLQWELGIERVYKTRTVQVTEFLECLTRIVMAQENEHGHALTTKLTGNALGVASTGAFCHLADDGAVVIPVDWR